MRNLFLVMLLLSGIFVNAQSICVSADCKDTTRYPQDTLSLNGMVTSGEGVKSTLWSVRQGIATIDNVTSQVTVARGLSKTGWYVFNLNGISNKGATGNAFDSTYYIGNRPPTAVTGPTVSTTTNSATLSGSGSFDAEGLPISYKWAETSGPNVAVFNSPNIANPTISGLINGTYNFTLTVTDSGNLISTATQIVIVNIPVTVIKTVTTVVIFYSDGTTKTTTTTVP